MTRDARLAMLRAAHRRALGTTARVEREVARVQVYASSAPEWSPDDLDGVAGASVGARGVSR